MNANWYEPIARRLTLTGRVQGVGFRPFVHRLAHLLELTGWVRNVAGQVEILIQGAPASLDRFQGELLAHPPPLSRPELTHTVPEAMGTHDGFRILASLEGSPDQAGVPPDLFACPECLAEMADEGARRFAYPFINCTQCGPRYTLIDALPYDRPRTAMAGFPLCPDCLREYRDPCDRRFHAQPLACPVCGPQVRFVDAEGQRHRHEAILRTVAALRAGLVVGIKGIGGYHLSCLAHDAEAVARIRRLKPRPDKPLAVMAPWQGVDGLDAVRLLATPTAAEAALLTDPMRPIVLLQRRDDAPLAPAIAPGLDTVGVMLPCSPLHHLLLGILDAPLVATSGNISGEPVLIDPDVAEARLGHVAQAWLHHDRPILRPVDDPVYRVIASRPRPLRLGRGNTPLERTLPHPLPHPLLATGGQIKNTVALAWKRRVVISPHIGDLDTPRGQEIFVQVGEKLQELYGVTAAQLICDAHPDYAASRWARRSGHKVIAVGHHAAHASALLGEHDPDTPAIVFTWDGVGLGPDNTLWGGEALTGRPGGWQRRATFRPFRPTGGERVAREPWRTLLALRREAGDDHPVPLPEGVDPELLHHARKQGLNTFVTHAVGRLFDAAAALILGITHTSFEGQAPMLLEAAARGPGQAIPLPLTRAPDGLWVSDWLPWLEQQLQTPRPPEIGAADFHATLAGALLAQARLLREETGWQRVGMTGGVFQNRRLTEQARALLEADGFTVLLARRIPCNDAGLAFGQVIEALYALS